MVDLIFPKSFSAVLKQVLFVVAYSRLKVSANLARAKCSRLSNALYCFTNSVICIISSFL